MIPQSLKPRNWQLPEWPDFRFDEVRLRPLEAEVMRRSGVHVGAFSHLESQEQEWLRVFCEGVDGFKGGLSSSNHLRITGCSPATATRDLARLVELGAMVRTGELKNARYFLKLIEGALRRLLGGE